MKRTLLACLIFSALSGATQAAPPTQIYIKNGTGYAADLCINGMPQGRIAGWKTAVFLGEGYVQTSKIEKWGSHGGWSRSDPVKVFALWDVDINNEGKASKYAWVEIDVTAAEDANGRTEVWLATDEPVNDADKNFAQKPIRYDSRICKRSDIPAVDSKGIAIKVGKYSAWTLKEEDADSWTDPQTGLTWRRGDNGSDVNWYQAGDYCAGLPGWQLPSMNELQSLYGRGETRCGTTGGAPVNCKVPPELDKLTSWIFWSRDSPGSGAAESMGLYVGIHKGERYSNPASGWLSHRALCVSRRS